MASREQSTKGDEVIENGDEGKTVLDVLPPISVTIDQYLRGSDVRWSGNAVRQYLECHDIVPAEEGEDETVLFHHSKVLLRATPTTAFVEGKVVITSNRVVFVSHVETEGSLDFLLSGNCIALHALQNPFNQTQDDDDEENTHHTNQNMKHTEDNAFQMNTEQQQPIENKSGPLFSNWSVYLQLTTDEDEEEHDAVDMEDDEEDRKQIDEQHHPIEITFCPLLPTTQNDIPPQKQLCQEIFDALSKVLITSGDTDQTSSPFSFASLLAAATGVGTTPTMMQGTDDDDDDDDDDEWCADIRGDEDDYDDDDDDDPYVCRIHQQDFMATIANGNVMMEDDNATMSPQERQRLLDRWDEVLLEPTYNNRPSIEGQFDDAD